MRQNWIEFITNKEAEKCNTVCLRPEYILAIQDRANEGTRLTYDCNSETGSIDITEPYEQVKQKVMDAERIDLSNVRVEHFTRDEYKYILDSLSMAHPDLYFLPQDEKQIKIQEKIRDKLNEILEEYK